MGKKSSSDKKKDKKKNKKEDKKEEEKEEKKENKTEDKKEGGEEETAPKDWDSECCRCEEFFRVRVDLVISFNCYISGSLLELPNLKIMDSSKEEFLKSMQEGDHYKKILVKDSGCCCDGCVCDCQSCGCGVCCGPPKTLGYCGLACCGCDPCSCHIRACKPKQCCPTGPLCPCSQCGTCGPRNPCAAGLQTCCPCPPSCPC